MDFVADQSQLFFSQLLHLREEHKGCSVLSVPHARHSLSDCNMILQRTREIANLRYLETSPLS